MTEAARPGEDATDRDLIDRWHRGDQRAATELVNRHARALARYAASMGEHADVDELVQDTFVRAFGSLETFRGESSLRTWLFTIERRLILDRRRSNRRERARIVPGNADAGTQYDSLDGVVADETQQRVREAVGRLTPTQREVFTLRVVEGRSYKEIAEIAGTTEGAARVHYHNAMRLVKEFLDV